MQAATSYHASPVRSCFRDRFGTCFLSGEGGAIAALFVGRVFVLQWFESLDETLLACSVQSAPVDPEFSTYRISLPSNKILRTGVLYCELQILPLVWCTHILYSTAANAANMSYISLPFRCNISSLTTKFGSPISCRGSLIPMRWCLNDNTQQARGWFACEGGGISLNFILHTSHIRSGSAIGKSMVDSLFFLFDALKCVVLRFPTKTRLLQSITKPYTPNPEDHKGYTCIDWGFH